MIPPSLILNRIAAFVKQFRLLHIFFVRPTFFSKICYHPFRMTGKTSEDLCNEIKRAIDQDGIEAVAAKLEVSVNYVYIILSGKRPISKDIARKLGYRQITFKRPDPQYIPA